VTGSDVRDVAGRDRTAVPWYQAVVAPRRVAVVGASSHPAKGSLLTNLLRLGFQGEVIPVNPRGVTIAGLPAVTDIREAADQIDLALIVVPAPQVPAAVRGCAEAEVRVAYIMSAGFAELGERGRVLQEQARTEAVSGGLRIVGPNTNGVISARAGLAGSIMTSVGDLPAPLARGGAAVITQSGAVGAFIFTGCHNAGLPVGTYLSTGNEADVGFEEVLGELVDDPSVELILAYAEGIRDGPGFIRAAERAKSAGKPIVLLKVGVTDEGARASASHTAAMAGSDVVYEGVLQQLGVRRARSLRELIDAGRLLSESPRGVGTRVGVVTISGGLAVMASDEIARRSLSLPSWADSSAEAFRQVLPGYLQISNPLDTSGVMADNLGILRAVLRTASADDRTDVTLLCLGGSRARERAVVDGLADFVPKIAKPTLVVWVGGSPDVYQRMRHADIIAFESVEDAIAALSLARAHVPDDMDQTASRPCGLPSRQAAMAIAVSMIKAARAAGRTALDEVESKVILRAYGLPCAEEAVVEPGADVAQVATKLLFPLVAKLRSAEVLHKSDVGGVLAGLADIAATRAAVADLLALAGRLGLRHAEVVLQEHVDIGVELILGASTDPTFGPVVSIGVGGLTAEVAPDVQVRLPSLARAEVYRALDSLRGRRLLRGFRGAAPAPRRQLADTVLRFAQMVGDLAPEISEIDINPLVVERGEGRLAALDALMILRQDAERD
jgi:acetate---CoA ligase (ADP-forming)